jgi:hypothetical protein
MGAFTGEPVKVSGPWIINLLNSSTSINADLYMLEMRSQTDKNMNLDSPRLIIGGDLEAQLTHSSNYGKGKWGTDLSDLDLDFLAQINPYANAYMQIKYDNSDLGHARRVDNSRLYVNKAFMTFGNLDKSPVYFSAGQMNPPFGRYASNMIDDPLTKLIGSAKARTVVLGYYKKLQNSLTTYGSAYLFKGDSYDSHHADNNSAVNNGGVDFGIKYSVGDFDANIGASYVDNLAEATQMQGTIFDKDHEQLDHKVPAIDIHTSFGYKDTYLLFLEYVAATKAFDSNDLSFGKDISHLSGAKPSAFAVEGIYNFTLLNKPTSFGLGYSTSRQALGLDIPKDRYLAMIQMEIYKQILLKLEYRHDVYYNNAYASHHGETCQYMTDRLGKTDNAVIAQVGVYF